MQVDEYVEEMIKEMRIKTMNECCKRNALDVLLDVKNFLRDDKALKELTEGTVYVES